MRCGLVHVRSG
jgi:hypothetical protein